MSTTIVAALLRQGDRLLLVGGSGPGDVSGGWMLPGGRVEDHENELDALARELAEETGLSLAGQPEVAFEVAIDYDSDVASGLHRAITYQCEATGELQPTDPDGIVDAAEWVAVDKALARLGELEWYECEPLRRFLAGEARAGAAYRYRVSGTRGTLVIGELEAQRPD